MEMTATDTRPTESTASAARILAGLVASFGAFLVLISTCGMLVFLILPFVRPRNALADNTVLASGCAIGLLFGTVIIIVGISVIRDKPLPRFILPTPWLFLGLFFIVVGIGQSVLFARVGEAYLFPPWHVLASLMLPVAALAFATRRLAPAPAQTVLAELAWGGAGSVMLALVLELVVGLFLFLGAVVFLAAVIGPDRVSQLVEQFRPLANGIDDPERVLALLTREPAVMIVAIGAGLAFFTIIGPLIEETLKALGPGIWIVRTRPNASRALLWGLAAGAGFAFSENLLLGSNIVTQQGGGGTLWALLVLARAGTSLVHVAATGTVSLGWYSGFVGGKRASFFLFYFAGFAAHGSWNLLTIVLSSVLSGAGAIQGAGGVLSGIGVVIAALSVAVFLTLILGAALWIAWLIRWAKRRDETGMRELS